MLAENPGLWLFSVPKHIRPAHRFWIILGNADLTIIYQPQNLDWDLSELKNHADNIQICQSLDDIIAKLKVEACSGGHFVLMSNGSFGGIYQRVQEG